jgi:hypothetical protein
VRVVVPVAHGRHESPHELLRGGPTVVLEWC